MEEDNSLSTKEWQLLLVLQELRGELTEQEKNIKLIEWVDKKIKDFQNKIDGFKDNIQDS